MSLFLPPYAGLLPALRESLSALTLTSIARTFALVRRSHSAQERDPDKITAIRDLSTRMQSSFLQRVRCRLPFSCQSELSEVADIFHASALVAPPPQAMLLSSITRATARLEEVQTQITAARTCVG